MNPSPRLQRFASEYAATGNAVEAARRSGYACPEKQAYRLSRTAYVLLHLDTLREAAQAKGAATRDETLAWLSTILRTGPPGVRIAAAGLLARLQGWCTPQAVSVTVAGVNEFDSMSRQEMFDTAEKILRQERPWLFVTREKETHEQAIP